MGNNSLIEPYGIDVFMGTLYINCFVMPKKYAHKHIRYV